LIEAGEQPFLQAVAPFQVLNLCALLLLPPAARQKRAGKQRSAPLYLDRIEQLDRLVQELAAQIVDRLGTADRAIPWTFRLAGEGAMRGRTARHHIGIEIEAV